MSWPHDCKPEWIEQLRHLAVEIQPHCVEPIVVKEKYKVEREKSNEILHQFGLGLIGQGWQFLAKFRNGFKVSIVCGNGVFGDAERPFELAVISPVGEVVETPVNARKLRSWLFDHFRSGSALCAGSSPDRRRYSEGAFR